MPSFIKSVLKNMLGKPATRRYPFVKRQAFEGARGQIQIDIDICIFCGLCVRRCPSNALAVSKDPKSWTVDYHKCIVCAACVDVCPKKCLHMQAEHGQFTEKA